MTPTPHDGHSRHVTCPNCGHRFMPGNGDRRTTGWRYRIRLYDQRDQDNAVADTDPERRPDDTGAAVARGLQGVMDDLVFMVGQYHGQQPVTGLEDAVLKQKIRGVRPTVSRHKGFATIRIKYQTGDRAWLARIDVVREEAK